MIVARHNHRLRKGLVGRQPGRTRIENEKMPFRDSLELITAFPEVALGGFGVFISCGVDKNVFLMLIEDIKRPANEEGLVEDRFLSVSFPEVIVDQAGFFHLGQIHLRIAPEGVIPIDDARDFGPVCQDVLEPQVHIQKRCKSRTGETGPMVVQERLIVYNLPLGVGSDRRDIFEQFFPHYAKRVPPGFFGRHRIMGTDISELSSPDSV